MALPPTQLSDMLYFTSNAEVYEALKSAGWLNDEGVANAETIEQLGQTSRNKAAVSEMPGPNHADIFADALLESGFLNEAGIAAYHADLRD